jgi:2-iminobutanoate/2-iminopropanoate deaminase
MTIVTTDKAPAAIGPYSQGYITGNLVFTSGQIPIDPATGELREGIEEQTEQSCRNVCEILKAAGSDAAKVVKTVCYLSDMSKFNDFNAVYEKYFTGRPARSCVEVAKLPKGAFCEIEAIAEL